MLTCPTCRTPFEGDAQFCPRDGTPLIPSTPTDPLTGKLLGGRYRLEGRLGQGGMGTVYRAVHTLMDKPVAVKVLRGDVAGDPEAVARFHREARSASRLDHEHCIRVTDFGQSDDGLLYLVMELLDGETLGRVVRAGPVEPRRAATIARAIAAALAHAHEQSVIHRDLKPDNVLLARRGRRGEVVKVLDFGLAKIAGEVTGGPSITKAGVVFGTPEYMAPEQAESGTLDARTDIYSLGVMLYQMVTGELPFRAPSFLALLSKHVEETPEAPRFRRPDLDIPEDLEAIILRCMEKAPDARFQSAAELCDALGPLADPQAPSLLLEPQAPIAEVSSTATSPSLDGAGPSVMSGEVVLPPRRGRALAIGAASVALLAAGGVGMVAFTHRSPTVTPAASIPPANPLVAARRLLGGRDLDGAQRVLAAARAAGDGPELQIVLGELALARGNRLGALAHYHRATRLAADQAEPHARLGSLLALLGQREAACKESRAALARDAKNETARTTVEAAGCR